MAGKWKNVSTFTSILLNESSTKKEAMKAEISQLIEQNVRFSAVIDEWTSISAKRFMSVMIKSNTKIFNLVMAPIHGSANASNLNGVFWERLKLFKLEKEHIVAIVSDGASVMKSMLAMNDSIQQ